MPSPAPSAGPQRQAYGGYLPPLDTPEYYATPGQYYPPPGHYQYMNPFYPPPETIGANAPDEPVMAVEKYPHTMGFPYSPPQPTYGSPYAACPTPVQHPDPLVYLGVAIPDPAEPPTALGTKKLPDYDPWKDYSAIVRATASGASDAEYLMNVLIKLSVFQMDALSDYFLSKQNISLTDAVASVASGNLRLALRALTLGPLGYDVDLARKALVGLGTNEMLLVELILGRPGHEIRWLKTAYKLRYGKDLVDDMKSDLSGSAERMFIMALNTQRPTSGPYDTINYSLVDADVEALNIASKKKDDLPFFEILINRSDQHIAAVITAFGARYKSLSKVIKKTFRGTVEHGLLFIVHGVKPKRDQQGIWRDAKLLEKSMAGLGTRDQQLVYRLVRAHWNPQRLEAIKDAYKRCYGKVLENRVRGETSGKYRDVLIAIVKSSDHC